MFSGVRGRQIPGRFIPVRTAPFAYNTTGPNRLEKLVATMEQSLRLHQHKPGTLITGPLPARSHRRHDRQPGSTHL